MKARKAAQSGSLSQKEKSNYMRQFHVAPGRTSAEHAQDAVQETALIAARPAGCRLLWWQVWLQYDRSSRRLG